MESLDAYMYVDEQTLQAFTSGVPTWLDTHWQNDGIDNRLFSGGVVPFACDSLGQEVALKKFARAHRAKHVQGPPRILLKVSIPAPAAVAHCLDGDIQIMLSGRPEKTIGFAKPVNNANFPSMVVSYREFNEADGTALLASGLELLSKN